MPQMTIPQAFKAHGIRAEYQGNPAMIVPLTADVVADLDQSKIKNGATAGQVLVSWNDGDARHGKVLNSDATNELSLFVERNDGEPARINTENWFSATVQLAEMRNRAKDDAARVAKINDERQASYQAALERGDRADEPEELKAEFADGAFANVDTLVDFVKAQGRAIMADQFATGKIRDDVNAFFKQIRNLTAVEVTSEEKARIDRARSIRAEIALLNPAHLDAVAGTLPKADYEGGEKARELFESLPQDAEGLTAAQQSLMMRNPDFNLVKRLFSVATTTDPMSIEKMALSHMGHQRIAQDFAKNVNEDSQTIVARMQAVTSDAMETYQWEGTLYTKDGADLLLMRDGYAAFAYVWDAESRVKDVNLDAALIGSYTEADLVSEDELKALEATLEEMQYDNGAEIDFDWDNEVEEAPDF